MLSLAILKEMGPWGSRPVFPETWDLLEQLTFTATDPEVLSGVLACLGWTCKPRALPTLLRFASHRHPYARVVVADNLLKCAVRIHDPVVVDALVRLSDDPDEDVRWSAFYDVAEWITIDTPEIVSLLGRRSMDRDPEVRKLAVGMRQKWLRRTRSRESSATTRPGAKRRQKLTPWPH